MDIEALNADLLELIQLKNYLVTLNYDDKNYDKVEESLHDQEDKFMEVYGEELEEVLEKVHEEVCPESEVLMPIAYLSNRYIENGFNEDGSVNYFPSPKGGVIVDAKDHPGKVTRLVFLPNPPRLVLQYDKTELEEVWNGEKNEE